MLEFKPLTIADKEKMEAVCFEECCPGAENCFNNMFIWQHLYSPEICWFGEQILLKIRAYGKTAFAYPMGEGDLYGAVEALYEYSKANDIPFVIMGHGELQSHRLEAEFRNCFEFTWDRDYSAYVHAVKNLADYPGKALHSKRNFCNQFEANNQWEFVPLTVENIPDCMSFMEKWMEEYAERLDPSVSHELIALNTAFENFCQLKLEGGALYANGEMAGFTMGEKCTDNCFMCHFEKARAEIKGAYAMVCRELARMVRDRHPEIVYINREEDMGIESLRRSKLSYKPDFLIHQFFAVWKGE